MPDTSVIATTHEYAITESGRLLLDLYRAEGSRAAVILLHGGAWVMGSRSDYDQRPRGLAQRGVTVASIDYRLAGDAPFPAQRADIESAAAWLIDTGVVDDPSQIVLMGASAGAHLAALALLTSHTRFAGFVGLFGRYDLTALGDAFKPSGDLEVPADIRVMRPPARLAHLDLRGRLALLAGVEAAQLDERLLKELSPAARISPGAPPMLLLHGEADAVVHHGHALHFASRAADAGVACEVVLIPEANHEDERYGGDDCLDRVAWFVGKATSRSTRLKGVRL
ncbi:alpha/beta hydrolase [Sphaerisporangium sp. NPDC051011]|uniref:alpha/beta hydrolase n=1 Tax=Sphaerisporangium sp. NPDC051011 TaxID=3155792 RepID=UPI0033DBA1EA